MDEHLFPGIQIMQFQFGMNLATRVAVYLIQAYKARKIQIHQKIIPVKVCGHTSHPGYESGAKREGMEGNFFSIILAVVSREALRLACMS